MAEKRKRGRPRKTEDKKVVKPMLPEEKIEESKYFAGPVVQKFEEERKEFELPSGYGDNKIVLMVRDPYWIYAYWEVNQKRIGEIKRELGEEIFSKSKECLRVYNVDNWDSFDIEATGGAKSWHIKVSTANASYCADVGFKTEDGRFIAAAHSNTVTTPSDRPSKVIDEEWMLPDWEKLYSPPSSASSPFKKR